MAKDIIQLAFSSEQDESMHSDTLEALLDSFVSSDKNGFDKQRYICPVSAKPFKNPVIAEDGCVYDKESLENARLNGQEVISHATGDPLDLCATMRQDSNIARELNDFIDAYNIANGGPSSQRSKIQIFITRVASVLTRCKESVQYVCSSTVATIRAFFAGCKRAILGGLNFIGWLIVTAPRVLLLLPLYLVVQACISIIRVVVIRLFPRSSVILDGLKTEVKKVLIRLFTRMYSRESNNYNETTSLSFTGQRIEQASLINWWYEKDIDIEAKFEAFFDKYIEKKKKNRDEADQKDPENYRCITTMAVFVDPVRASDGHCYSKKA